MFGYNSASSTGWVLVFPGYELNIRAGFHCSSWTCIYIYLAEDFFQSNEQKEDEHFKH